MATIKQPLQPKVIDTTLREGAQAPGVRFGIESSVEIARNLMLLPVDMIECGHPKSSEIEAERVRAVVAACDGFPVLAHARARVEDIDAVKESGAQWVGVFVGVNSISKTCRVKEPSILKLIKDAIKYAVYLGLKVRFTVEDASRTHRAELLEACHIAVEAGADRLCFADTVGILCPWEVEELVTSLCTKLKDIELEVHFHDDRGMANANALSAIRAGATWVSSSVNGIGERCGVTDTLILLANLGAQKWRPLPDGNQLQHISKVVQSHSRLQVDHWRPVVGRNSFTHTARLHQTAVNSDGKAYSWIDPRSLGRFNSTELENFPNASEQLISNPQIISATELRHHRHGPGDRYLMVDNRLVEGARQYCIVRHIPKMVDFGKKHVDSHRHNVDSIFLFIGHEEGLTGLTAEVNLGEETFEINSPCSVFIPSGLFHSYKVIEGEGLFINHVLAGDYDSSLLDDTAPKTISAATIPKVTRSLELTQHEVAQISKVSDMSMERVSPVDPKRNAMQFLTKYVNGHNPGCALTPEHRVDEMFDSLAYLDFFLHMESFLGQGISLDELASCQTFTDVANLMVSCCPQALVEGGQNATELVSEQTLDQTLRG